MWSCAILHERSKPQMSLGYLLGQVTVELRRVVAEHGELKFYIETTSGSSL